MRTSGSCTSKMHELKGDSWRKYLERVAERELPDICFSVPTSSLDVIVASFTSIL